MEALLSIAGIVVALIILNKGRVFQIKGISKSLIIILFAIKLFGAIGLWQYYEKMNDRTNADIFKFYDDGIKLKAGILENPDLYIKLMFFKNDASQDFDSIFGSLENWNANEGFLSGSGHRFMIRLNALLAFFTGGNYLLHLLFFTFISFLGIVLIVKAWPINVLPKKIFLILSTISPTLLFWTSGILKESVIIFFFGSLIYLLQSQNEKSSWIKSTFFALVLSLLFVLKPYVGVSVVIALLLVLAFRYIKLSMHKVALSALVILFLGVILIPMDNPFSAWSSINKKRISFVDLAEKNQAQSLIEIPIINHPSEVLYKGPQAVINVIFRPHIFELNSKSYLPFALESCLLLVLLISTVFYFKKPDKVDLKFIYPSLFFILVLTMIVGLSTPILGASVRYRAPAILLIYGVIIIFIDYSKIYKFKPFHRKKE